MLGKEASTSSRGFGEVYRGPSWHSAYSDSPSSFPWNAKGSQREVMVSFSPLSAAGIPPPPHLFAFAVIVRRCVVRTGSAGSWTKATHFYLPTPMVDTQSEEECLDKELNIQTSQQKLLSSDLLCTWSKSAAFGLTEFMQITGPCDTTWDKWRPNHQELASQCTCQQVAHCMHRRHFWVAAKPGCCVSGNLQDMMSTSRAPKILGKSFKGSPVHIPGLALWHPHLLFRPEGKMSYSKTFRDPDHYSM